MFSAINQHIVFDTKIDFLVLFDADLLTDKCCSVLIAALAGRDKATLVACGNDHGKQLRNLERSIKYHAPDLFYCIKTIEAETKPESADTILFLIFLSALKAEHTNRIMFLSHDNKLLEMSKRLNEIVKPEKSVIFLNPHQNYMKTSKNHEENNSANEKCDRNKNSRINNILAEWITKHPKNVGSVPDSALSRLAKKHKININELKKVRDVLINTGASNA
jgi:hypothetical protein